MKHKLSVKIFAIFMIAFIAVLYISATVSFRTQKNMLCENIRERYNLNEVSHQICELYKKYGLDETISDQEALDIIHTSEFRKDFQKICPGYCNYLFVSYHDLKNNINRIEEYTLGKDYLDDYVNVYNSDINQTETISIQDLKKEDKEKLLLLLEKQNTAKEYNEDDIVFIKYQIINQQLVYFECKDILYGQRPQQYKEGEITNFCILEHLKVADFIHWGYWGSTVVDLKEMKNYTLQASRSHRFVASGGYSSFWVQKDQHTYFFTQIAMFNENTNIQFNVANVVDNIDQYVMKIYFEENMHLYIGTFVIAIFISILLSYMISKPIKKIEKVALKIAHQDFNEEIKIKSKDEIGSLAMSIDMMRKQLKDTISQLEQEIEKVKKLESLRKDFINQFTHEMKTPLGIINGYNELIEETENTEEVQKYLNVIHRETERINQLILSMLSLSRLESRKVELKKEDFDLEDLVTEVIDEYEVLLMKKNIQIQVKTDISQIYADQQLIKTVVHNFLSNAIKHTFENGHIIVTINHGLSIYNEGHLIQDGHFEDIWYTFVTHDQKGSGLGLAICRSILELHEFDYGVKNKERGVEFYFYSV